MFQANRARSEAMPFAWRVFLFTLLVADALALAFTAFGKFVLHRGWPYDSILLNVPFAGDLHPFDPQLPFLHTSAFFDPHWISPYSYPAPMVLPYALLYRLPHENVCFVALVLLIAVGSAYAFYRGLRRHTSCSGAQCAAFAALLLLSYPLAFEIWQGNLEIFVVILVAGGIWAFCKGKLHLAAALLGAAASMKLFPVLYMGLFLYRRRYGALCTGILAGLAVTLLGLYTINPSLAFAWRMVQHGSHTAENDLLGVWRQIGYDHSLFGLVKLLYSRFVLHSDRCRSGVLHAYVALVGSVGVAVYLLRIRRLPAINQIAILSLCSVWLPPISYDYTLLHLYIPIALLALYSGKYRDLRSRSLLTIMACLALLVASQAEIVYRGHFYGGQLKAVVLLVAVVTLLWKPLEDADLPDVSTANYGDQAAPV